MEPEISVIIPVKPGENSIPALESLRKTDYPLTKIEIIMAEGCQPSRQRNMALKEAGGEIVYYLDNDSLVEKDLFRKAAVHYENPEIDGAGGPSLTALDDTFIQKCFGYIFSSYLCASAMRAKFTPVGKARLSTEKELILCNLSFKTRVMKESGGFNEKLYPNEENELVNRLLSRGKKIIYDPEIFIRQSRRKNIFEFIKQLFRYGRGRGEHLWVNFRFFKPLFIIPSAFILYLISLIFFRPWFYIIPVYLYAFITIIASLLVCAANKDWKALPVLPFLFLFTHLSYGTGVITGLASGWAKQYKMGEVTVRKIKKFSDENF
ncbi:MAG: glycosyltransferase [Firmicutes bacterium]|nr:glycosyltransferase [Bacillota bacterium]